MEFDVQWLLTGVPVAFGLGWLASRLDLRQVKHEQQHSPKAYYKGLNLLLNEQQDKAIDAFIEAVQHDPDTTDLHFALGNLFRRRGEFERAVRVHQHLLNRADLSSTDHDRAQYALAQDFLKAGLFDRAEQAYRALEGTPFEVEARLALLSLHERSRDWQAAQETAGVLERMGTGSFAMRISHYWCELAAEADAKGHAAEAETALQRACAAAPHSARPWLVMGQRWVARQQPEAALAAWQELRTRASTHFPLIALDYAEQAVRLGQTQAALEVIRSAYDAAPALDLLRAQARLTGQPFAELPELMQHLQRYPTLSAAQAVLSGLLARTPVPADVGAGVTRALEVAARPVQRYRCACCGFEAQRYFWQCPGCLSWDSFPPTRLDEQ